MTEISKQGNVYTDYSNIVRGGQSSTVPPEDITAAVEDLMTFHPWTATQIDAGKPVREAAKQLVHAIISNVPPSADRTAAIRHVREGLYSANAAITHDGRY